MVCNLSKACKKLFPKQLHKLVSNNYLYSFILSQKAHTIKTIFIGFKTKAKKYYVELTFIKILYFHISCYVLFETDKDKIHG